MRRITALRWTKLGLFTCVLVPLLYMLFAHGPLTAVPPVVPALPTRRAQTPTTARPQTTLGSGGGGGGGTFEEALKTRANSDNVIILSSVDSAYLHMALNLYETSFLRLGLDNYLFVCSDTKAYAELRQHGIAAYDYLHDKDSTRPSNYGSAAFSRKTHLKIKIVFEALRLNLTALIVDVDIVLFKDPLPYFRDCADCDIQIQTDITEGNTGFYLARPTKATMQLIQTALKIGNTRGEKVMDQKALDRNMEKMMKTGTIKVKTLNKTLFPPGCVYFEDGKRMFHFDNPPKQEVIVHNNWIVSLEAKVYRFKEQLLWSVDVNGYYSDPHRKYLAYNNPLDFGNTQTLAEENSSLRTALALAHILNRTLILPEFTCRHCKYGACKTPYESCSFNTHYKIQSFDQYFQDRYREHVFLDHPKVPESIKNPEYETYLIMVDKIYNLIEVDESFKLRTPKDSKRGATVEEIVEWFGSMTEPVLKLHSLYGAFGDMNKMDKSFRDKLQKALNTKTDYRQY